MKNLFYLCAFLFFIVHTVKSQSTITKYTIDFKDPQSVLNSVFYAAQTEDFAILQCLCDPYGENDGDTRSLCSISNLYEQTIEFGDNENTQLALKQFVTIFQLGRISGSITFEEIEGVKFVNVPFIFNHPGGETRKNESMKLVNRYGNWYLYSF